MENYCVCNVPPGSVERTVVDVASLFHEALEGCNAGTLPELKRALAGIMKDCD